MLDHIFVSGHLRFVVRVLMDNHIPHEADVHRGEGIQVVFFRDDVPAGGDTFLRIDYADGQ